MKKAISYRLFGLGSIPKKLWPVLEQEGIAVSDPRIANLYVDTTAEQNLCISFESSIFQEGWQGVIQLVFHTEKARQFSDVLNATQN